MSDHPPPFPETERERLNCVDGPCVVRGCERLIKREIEIEKNRRDNAGKRSPLLSPLCHRSALCGGPDRF